MSSRRVVVSRKEETLILPNLKDLQIKPQAALSVVPEDDSVVIEVNAAVLPVNAVVSDIGVQGKLQKGEGGTSVQPGAPSVEPGGSRRKKAVPKSTTARNEVTADVAWIRDIRLIPEALYEDVLKACDSINYSIRSQAVYYNNEIEKKQAEERRDGKPVTDYERVTNHNAVEYFMFGMPFQYWKGMAFCLPDCNGMRQSDGDVCTRQRQDMSLFFVHSEVQTPAPAADGTYDHMLNLRRNIYVYGLPQADASNQGIVSLSYTALKDMQDQSLGEGTQSQKADAAKRTTEADAQEDAKQKQPPKGLEQFQYSRFYSRAKLEDNIIAKVWSQNRQTRADAVKRFRRATRYRFEILRLWMKLFLAQQSTTRVVAYQAAGLNPENPLEIVNSPAAKLLSEKRQKKKEQEEALEKAAREKALEDATMTEAELDQLKAEQIEAERREAEQREAERLAVERNRKEFEAKRYDRDYTAVMAKQKKDAQEDLNNLQEANAIAVCPLAIFELRHVTYAYVEGTKTAKEYCLHDSKTLYLKGPDTNGFRPDKGPDDFNSLPKWRKPGSEYWPVVDPDVNTEFAWFNDRSNPRELAAFMTPEEKDNRIPVELGVSNREVFVLLNQLFDGGVEDDPMTGGSSSADVEEQDGDGDAGTRNKAYTAAKGLEIDVSLHEDPEETDLSQFRDDKPVERSTYGIPYDPPTVGVYSTKILSPFNMYAPMIDTMIRGIVKAMPLWACAYLSEQLVDDQKLAAEFERDSVMYDDILSKARMEMQETVSGEINEYYVNKRLNQENAEKIKENKDRIYELAKRLIDYKNEREVITESQGKLLQQNAELRMSNALRKSEMYIRECEVDYYASMRYMTMSLHKTPSVVWNAYATRDPAFINTLDSRFLSIDKQGLRNNIIKSQQQLEYFDQQIIANETKGLKFEGLRAVNEYYKYENQLEANSFQSPHTWAHEQVMRCVSEISFPVQGEGRSAMDYVLSKDVMGYEVRVGDQDASGIYEQWYHQVYMNEGMYRVGQIVVMQDMINAACFFNVSHYAQLQGHTARIEEIVPCPHTEESFVSHNLYIVQTYYEYNGHLEFAQDKRLGEAAMQQEREKAASVKESADTQKKLPRVHEVYLVSDPFVPFRSHNTADDDQKARRFFRAAVFGDFLWPYDASIDPDKLPWAYSSLVEPKDESIRNQRRLCIGYNMFDKNENLTKWYGTDKVLEINQAGYPKQDIDSLKELVAVSQQHRVPTPGQLRKLQMRKRWQSSELFDTREDRKNVIFPEKFRAFTQFFPGGGSFEKLVMPKALDTMPKFAEANKFKARKGWLVTTLTELFAETFVPFIRLGMGVFTSTSVVTEGTTFKLYSRDLTSEEDNFEAKIRGQDTFDEVSRTFESRLKKPANA